MDAKSTQKKKTQFRKSIKWNRFKQYIKKFFNGIDPITLKPLRPGWNIHHLLLDPERYELLLPELFLPLNKTTHKMLHYIYGYYRTDPQILDRLDVYLKQMEDVNNDHTNS